MNSRERVLAALNFKEPDGVPIDIYGGAASFINATAYANMLEEIGAKDRTIKLYDVVQSLVEPSTEFIDRFHADIIPAGKAMHEDWKDYELTDGTKAKVPQYFSYKKLDDGSMLALNVKGEEIGLMPNSVNYYSQTRFPYIDGYPENYDNFDEDCQQVIWTAFPKDPYQLAGEPNFWERMRDNAKMHAEEGKKAVSIIGGGSFFETGSSFRRIDNMLMDLIQEKPKVFKFFDMLLERYLKRIDTIIDTMGDYVDIIRFWDDFGANNGPLFSKALYREMIKPYQKAMCDHIKKRSNIKTFLHSCGSVYQFIPDFIDAGIDILNPVQISTKNMEPAKLKTEFGKDIVFWGGGCDTVNVLSDKTPAEIRAHTIHNLEIFSKGGGYVFAPTHNVLSNVPAKNAVAMYDAVIEFNNGRSA